MVSEQPGDELGEVAGVATLGRIGEPVRIREARRVEVELLRLRVHPADEGPFVPGESLGERRRRVVRRCDRHALQQDVERDGLARTQAHPGPRRQRGVPADRDQLVELGAPGLDVLEREVERHELHEAGGRPFLVGILGEERAALGVEQQDRFRGER